MRNTIVNEIEILAGEDDKIVIVTADLGYGVLNSFAQRFPERCINVGISEQAMASIAAGLALTGQKVFTYSIGNFPTLRCIEQIRNDICYHNLNVKILAVGSGFVYGQLGMSHHATEDISAMRALPNMRVYAPADPMEAISVLHEAMKHEGPCYIRLGRGGEQNQHPSISHFDVNKGIEICKGNDLNILCIGSILVEAKKAASQLKGLGISAGLYSMPAIKPSARGTIERLARENKLLVTLEEHTIVGGFGGSIAEILAEMTGRCAKLCRIGLNDEFTCKVGSQEYLRDFYGVTAPKIVERILKELKLEGFR